MTDLYRAIVTDVTPKKGRTCSVVSLQVVQLAFEGGLREPRRDEPDYYANFLDEGRLDVSLAIDIPSGMTVGKTWTSGAFWDGGICA
ncbi:MAG: hypothetical protein WCJ30_14620 [Deltaproteobacteria bacterium]